MHRLDVRGSRVVRLDVFLGCVNRLDVMCKTDGLLNDKQGFYEDIYEKMSKV